MRFKEFMVSFNSFDLLKSKINIKRIRISQSVINAYISPSGHANWEIDTSTDTTSNDKASPLDLNINRFSIRGPASFNYESRPDSMALQGSGLMIEAGIKADTLNVSELLTAASRGTAYSEASDESI